MSTQQAQRFEALRQEIDDRNITGPMRKGSQIQVNLDEEPGGGIDGADLYTQQILEFRPVSQADGKTAPRDIRETWIKGNQQFDFEIRVRPICPSCNTLMGVGDLPDYLMGQCHECLVDTCPVCLKECISCEKMMCNQHRYGHGVEGGPFCADCLEHVFIEKEWQRQLDAYNLELKKMDKQLNHREVMDQIHREDERARIQELLEYYKHQEDLEAELIQSWMSEMLEQNRFEQELAQQDRESQREHAIKQEEQFLKDRELDIEERENERQHNRKNREMDIEERENKREHNRKNREMNIKEEKIEKEHERDMYGKKTDRKKMNKKHEREMYSNRTDRKKMNKNHRRENKKIDNEHQETMEKHRIEEKKADQKHSREKSKTNKKHSREQQKINNDYKINKQKQDRKDRQQKIEAKKAKQIMDLRETLQEEGYRRKPPQGSRSKLRKKKPATSIEIE